MSKLGGGGMIIAGILIALFGVLLVADILDWLFRIAGIILIAVGAIMVISGVMSRGNRGSSL